MKFAASLLAIALLASNAAAQITVLPARPVIGQPIRAWAPAEKKATLGEEVVTDYQWSHDDRTHLVATADKRGVYIWAELAPGQPSEEHWLTLRMTVATYDTREILVPGPNFPTDPTDIKKETLRFLVDKVPTETRQPFTVHQSTDPQPTPPQPDPEPEPQPQPAPIPAAGLHVLILEETDDRGRIDKGQLGVLQTVNVAAYVRGKQGQFRQYDAGVKIGDPLWESARNRPRASLPWIIVSNGAKGGYEGPLPKSIDEALALIRRFE
jgi:cell division septation protein DedD